MMLPIILDIICAVYGSPEAYHYPVVHKILSTVPILGVYYICEDSTIHTYCEIHTTRKCNNNPAHYRASECFDGEIGGRVEGGGHPVAHRAVERSSARFCLILPLFVCVLARCRIILFGNTPPSSPRHSSLRRPPLANSGGAFFLFFLFAEKHTPAVSCSGLYWSAYDTHFYTRVVPDLLTNSQ